MPGGPGRKPKPANLHLLTNPNWRAKKKAKQEYPKPKGDLPKDPPDWLSSIARDEYRRVVESLENSGILTSVDLATLEQYCYWYGEFRYLTYVIEIEGYMVFGAMGGLKENPHVRMAREASRKCLEFCVQLGLTPSSRMKLGKDKPKDEDDPFAKHEAQGKPKGKRSA